MTNSIAIGRQHGLYEEEAQQTWSNGGRSQVRPNIPLQTNHHLVRLQLHAA